MKNAMTALAAVAAAALVCGAMAVCHVRAVAAEPAGPPAAEQVQALAAKLSDSDFRVREAAYKDLVKAGPAALPALEQAERSDDTEVQQRAAAAMKEIRAAVAAALSAELPKNYLWSYPMEHGAFAGPVLAGATLCAPGRDAKLHAIDAKTGKELWIAEMPGKAMLLGLLQMSANENVVAIVENLTVLAVFDVKKGGKLWQKDLVPATGSVGRPFAVVAGDLVVARVGADRLKAFKAATGEDVWEMEVKAGSIFCTPLLAGGVLCLSEGDGLSAVDLAKQKRLWSKDVGACSHIGRGGDTVLAVVGDKILGLAAKDGAKLWEAEAPGAGAPPGPNVWPIARMVGLRMAVDDDRVYLIAGEELTTFGLKKGDRNSVKLDLSLPAGAVEDIAEGMMMTSAYSAALRWSAIGGALYVGSSKGLFAFDGKTGQRLWGLPKRNLPSGEPLAVGDVLYFGTASFAASPLDDKLSPKDQPGLHALRLAGAAPAAAPAERH